MLLNVINRLFIKGSFYYIRLIAVLDKALDFRKNSHNSEERSHFSSSIRHNYQSSGLFILCSYSFPLFVCLERRTPCEAMRTSYTEYSNMTDGIQDWRDGSLGVSTCQKSTRT